MHPRLIRSIFFFLFSKNLLILTPCLRLENLEFREHLLSFVSKVNTFQGMCFSYLSYWLYRNVCAQSLHFPVTPCTINAYTQCHYYCDELKSPKVCTCCCQTSKRSNTHTLTHTYDTTRTYTALFTIHFYLL